MSSIRNILVSGLILLLSLASSNSLAQESGAENVPVLKMRTKAEFLDQQERISGGAVVGVVFYNPKDKVKLEEAHVYLAEPMKDGLEMQLATVDGRYLATFDYAPGSPVKGWVRLDLSLRKPGFLSNYDLNEVALLMTDADTGVAYPVRWGDDAQAKYVRVYINTEGSRSYFVSYNAESNTESAVSCTPASDKSSFKFDRICDVPVGDVYKRTEIEIIRKRGGGFGTPIDIRVSLPPEGSE